MTGEPLANRTRALVEDLVDAALTCRRAAAGDATALARDPTMQMAALRGQLRGRKATEAPHGVDAAAWCRLVTVGRVFLAEDTAPAGRAHLAEQLVNDGHVVLAALPEETAPRNGFASRKDIFG